MTNSNVVHPNVINPKIADTTSSLQMLRDGIAQAEKQILHLDRTNIEDFLLQLDQNEKMFGDFGADQTAILAESGRWSSLLKRLTSQPQLIVDATSYVGGLPKLRSKHQPATGFWWHMDDAIKQRRIQTIKKVAMALGAIVVIAGVMILAINFFTRGNQSATVAANSSATIEQLVVDGKWQEALTQVQIARTASPQQNELLIWESILSEKLGDSTRAQAALAEAQQNPSGTNAEFWTLVGTDRQIAGDLEGAEQAAQRALVNAPQDPQVTFLLASIAEARGDSLQAADYFSKTIALAEGTNPELIVVAKMRMGMLMQQVQPIPVPMPEQTITTTSTSTSP